MKTFFFLLTVVLLAGATGCRNREVSPYNSLSVQTISVSLSISSNIARAKRSDNPDEAPADRGAASQAPGSEGKTQNPPLVTTHN